jgi:hypothetical protein
VVGVEQTLHDLSIASAHVAHRLVNRVDDVGFCAPQMFNAQSDSGTSTNRANDELF